MKDKILLRAGKIFLTLCICAMSLVFYGCAKKGGEDAQLIELREPFAGDKTGEPDGKGEDGAKDGAKDISGGPQGSRGEEKKVVVHVCGAVNNPGVYTLTEGLRVYDALRAAGGINDDGCGEVLNQAKLLKDGERIYVPTKEEAPKGGFSAGGANEPVKVDINTASREELMTLPGIGESKADGIISYRESKGGFESIEEIKNVEGIKEGVYGKIKDKITV